MATFAPTEGGDTMRLTLGDGKGNVKGEGGYDVCLEANGMRLEQPSAITIRHGARPQNCSAHAMKANLDAIAVTRPH